ALRRRGEVRAKRNVSHLRERAAPSTRATDRAGQSAPRMGSRRPRGRAAPPRPRPVATAMPARSPLEFSTPQSAMSRRRSGPGPATRGAELLAEATHVYWPASARRAQTAVRGSLGWFAATFVVIVTPPHIHNRLGSPAGWPASDG